MQKKMIKVIFLNKNTMWREIPREKSERNDAMNGSMELDNFLYFQLSTFSRSLQQLSFNIVVKYAISKLWERV